MPITAKEILDTYEKMTAKKPNKGYKLNTSWNQSNQLFRPSLNIDARSRKARDTSEDLVKQMERDIEVRAMADNLFVVPPIITGDNQVFIDRLNAIFSKSENGFRILRENRKIFFYQPTTKRVTIYVPHHTCILITPHLANILGFGEKTRFTFTTTAVYNMDPYGDVYTVFVYTDAIQKRRVGDSQVPLLRCVAVNRGDNKRGGIQAISFPHLHYFPLKSKRLDGVGIYLRDRSGEPISFLRGEVTVTLHLRPIERD